MSLKAKHRSARHASSFAEPSISTQMAPKHPKKDSIVARVRRKLQRNMDKKDEKADEGTSTVQRSTKKKDGKADEGTSTGDKAELLHNEYSVQLDKLEKARRTINDQYSVSQIDMETKKLREDQAEEAFYNWLKEHREGLERCWGKGWYEQKIRECNKGLVG